MHQQHICPQMPHKCHTCQLLHVQILDTYAINKVTEAMLSIHSTFLAYATEQHMLVTLHIYVPFYVYSSLQIGPTLLNTSLRNQWTATFICHTTAKYVQTHKQTHRCNNRYKSSPRHSIYFFPNFNPEALSNQKLCSFPVILVTTPYQA